MSSNPPFSPLWLFTPLMLQDKVTVCSVNFTSRKKNPLHTVVSLRNMVSDLQFCYILCLCVSYFSALIEQQGSLWCEKHIKGWIEPLKWIYFCTYREEMLQEHQALLERCSPWRGNKNIACYDAKTGWINPQDEHTWTGDVRSSQQFPASGKTSTNLWKWTNLGTCSGSTLFLVTVWVCVCVCVEGGRVGAARGKWNERDPVRMGWSYRI